MVRRLIWENGVYHWLFLCRSTTPANRGLSFWDHSRRRNRCCSGKINSYTRQVHEDLRAPPRPGIDATVGADGSRQPMGMSYGNRQRNGSPPTGTGTASCTSTPSRTLQYHYDRRENGSCQRPEVPSPLLPCWRSRATRVFGRITWRCDVEQHVRLEPSSWIPNNPTRRANPSHVELAMLPQYQVSPAENVESMTSVTIPAQHGHTDWSGMADGGVTVGHRNTT